MPTARHDLAQAVLKVQLFSFTRTGLVSEIRLAIRLIATLLSKYERGRVLPIPRPLDLYTRPEISIVVVEFDQKRNTSPELTRRLSCTWVFLLFTSEKWVKR